MDKQKNVPKGKIKRSAIVGTATAKAGLKKIGHLSKKPFLSEDKKKTESDRNDEEIAQMIFKALSNLRGTALKAAQMIAMEMELIPEIYRRELIKATSQVPPINRALIRKIITRELGTPEKIFNTFESQPFAAASLGQVHRAVSNNGEELAVKVQYPGIAEGVKTDIDMLKILLKPTKYFKIFKLCFDEIQEKINEELDYYNEAKNTKWFNENLKFDNVIIPEVISEYSTKNVITTTRVHGLHLEQWLETNPSKEAKNNYGQLLVDIFYHTTYKELLIHADPNPGNYLFRDDGKLGIIDFGCVKKLTSDFINNMYLVNSSENDMSDIKNIYDRFGVFYKCDYDDKEFQNFIIRWFEWITRPQRSEYFDFSNNDQYFSESLNLMKEFYSFVDHMDGSFIYFGRTEFGLFRILQRLGAKVNMQLPKNINKP